MKYIYIANLISVAILFAAMGFFYGFYFGFNHGTFIDREIMFSDIFSPSNVSGGYVPSKDDSLLINNNPLNK